MVVYNKSAQLIGIDKLIPYHANAKKHPKEQIDKLASIITEYGFQSPILVDKNMVIIAGHGRLQAAQKLGLKEVPYWVADNLSEAQVKGLRLADNRVAESEWDLDLLKLEFSELNDLDFDLDLTGFSTDEIDLEPEKKEGLTDEDAVPEVKENEFGVQRGDIWQLGEHRVMCGDSSSKEDVDRLMAGEKADMVFTDPPYNIASDSKNYAADKSKAMNDLKNADWDKDFDIKPAIDMMREFSSKNCTYYIWTSQFLIQDIWNKLKEWCDFVSYCVWNKPNPMPSLSKRHWTWNTELCAYGSFGSKRVVNFPKDGHALSTWTITKKSDGTHPTQKPIELIEPVIGFSSNKGQSVLDLFGGSGSTLIACEKTGRKCFMSEIDPHYVSVIIKRWEDFTGKQAVKL